MRFVLVMLIIWLASISVFLVLAHAHEADTGWLYHEDCCSDQDCYSVPAKGVREIEGGYWIEATGEVLMRYDPRIRESLDGRYHRCSSQGNERESTICLYVPMFGS